MSNRETDSHFYVKRGLKAEYETAQKRLGELYYLTDTNEIAGYQGTYPSRIDGGYFADYKDRSKLDGVEGGEF